MMEIPVLYEDEYFLAVNKPPGLPSQATLDTQRSHLFGELQKKYPGIALHHRLDKDTSGVMLFAKVKEANIPLAEMFQKHKIQKTYLCLTAPKIQKSPFHVKNYLAPFSKSRKERSRMILVHKGGQAAETDFKILESYSLGHLIEARPLTGRMHQIRVHLSSRGLGIFGDDLYSSPVKPVAPRLMLHAFRLEFVHPFTGAAMNIEAPIPEDFLNFQKQLK